MSENFTVTAINHPMGLKGRHAAKHVSNISIQQIIDDLPLDTFPLDKREFLVARVNNTVVPRSMWSSVTIKAQSKVVTCVDIRLPVANGGAGGGAKSVIGAVAAIAILAFTAFVAAPFAVGLLGLTGTVTGSIVSAGIIAAGSVAAALAFQALSPPPAQEARGAGADPTRGAELGASFAKGNVLAPDGAIPRVLGRRQVFPPFACQPLVEIVGDTEVIEALYILNGAHELNDIRINEVPIDQFAGITYQVREGFDSDLPQTLVNRYSSTQNTNAELIGHKTKQGTTQLEDQTNVNNSIPQWQRYQITKNPDEIWLTLDWQRGFIDTSNPTVPQAMAVRTRIRPVGSGVWRYLPEVHFTAVNYQRVRKMIKIIWGDPLPSVPTVPTDEAPFVAFKTVPGQTNTPPTSGYAADNYFDDGTQNINGVDNVAMYQDRVEIYVNDVDFPRNERYEVEIIRSYAYDRDLLNHSTYIYNAGDVHDFFAYEDINGSPSIFIDQANRLSTLNLSRVSSVYNDNPVPKSGFARLAVRGVNIGVTDVTTVAGAYVPDWNGTDWSELRVTPNPAPHFRHVLSGDLTSPIARVPPAEIDEQSLIDWREYCDSQSLEVSAIIDQRSMAEVLQIIASSAFGRLRRSHTIGVVVDKDRSDDDPIQLFTPMNSNNFEFETTFRENLDGFRVNFVNKNENWKPDSALVLADGITPETAGRVETVTFDSITREDLAISRARYDLNQMLYRSNRYSLKVDIEQLVVERGSLVGVSHDLITRGAGWGRILEIVRNGSNEVTTLRLETTLTLPDSTPFYDADFYTASPFYEQGEKAHVAAKDSLGDVVTLGTATGVGTDPLFTNEFVLDNPVVVDDLLEGDLASVASSTTVYERMVVLDIEPGEDLSATLVLVDEAPELFTTEPIIIDVTAGALALRGQVVDVDVTGTVPIVVDVVAGLMTLTGQSVPVGIDTNVDVVAGTMTLTGQSVDIVTGPVVDVVASSMTLSGQAVTIDQVIDVLPGRMTLRGQTVTITLQVNVTAGNMQLNGQSVDVLTSIYDAPNLYNVGNFYEQGG